jgi:hypothetical protein
MLFTLPPADCAMAAGMGAAGISKVASSTSARYSFRDNITARINASCRLPPLADGVAQ